MEPQQIRYPGSFLDILQRKDMVEGKEVVLTAREFDILALMARHSGRRHTYAKKDWMRLGRARSCGNFGTPIKRIFLMQSIWSGIRT